MVRLHESACEEVQVNDGEAVLRCPLSAGKLRVIDGPPPAAAVTLPAITKLKTSNNNIDKNSLFFIAIPPVRIP